MSDFKLDEVTGDLLIKDGDFVLTNDENGETLRQALQIAINTFRGEWFLNILYGLPYLFSEWTDKGGKGYADATLRAYIINVNGVERITQYSSSLDKKTRVFTVNFTVLSTDGVSINVQETI